MTEPPSPTLISHRAFARWRRGARRLNERLRHVAAPGSTASACDPDAPALTNLAAACQRAPCYSLRLQTLPPQEHPP